MISWISKINWGRTLLVGLLYTVVATIVHQIEAIITMKYYLMPEHFGVWSKLMMPVAGPSPASFLTTSTILTMVTGVSLAIVYYYLKDMLPKAIKERVFLFADLLVGLNFIFFILPTYLMFNVPTGILGYWFVSNFIILLTTAYLNVKLLK